ncbi:glycosyltransferase 87 family protein [Cuniculiplasma sp. SKW3]|uniref:glycosyltransferase 87 family protein n=1 Tax=unclassified Cuniculiplasma TaxID=2619706 RepID=UPI003FD2EBF5
MRCHRWIFIFIVICYFVISPFTSYAYDESFYFQYFRWVYLYSVQPYYLWVFGSFYNSINIGSLGINLPFYLLGIDNVIIQQFTVKLPYILAAILSSLAISRTLNHITHQNNRNIDPALMFLLLPITIFDVVIFGNPLIIAIMFLVLTLLCLVNNKTSLSSLFLGMSAATYLYPIFFVLPFLKVVNNNNGKRKMLSALGIFALTFAVGQFLPLMISILTSTPISTTVLAPLLGLRSSITVTSNIPSSWGPYFIFYIIFHVSVGSFTLEAIYLLSMLLPMFYFLFTKKEITLERFLDFLFLESLMFVIFSITATPQYLLSIAPFAVYFYYSDRSKHLIQILSFATLLDVLLLFNNLPLLYFFSNLNPSLAYSYDYLIFPSLGVALLSLIYIASLLIMLIYHFRADSINEIYLKRFNKKIKSKSQMNGSYTYIKRGTVLLLAILVITLLVAAPLANNAPKNMYFTSQADSETISATHGVQNDGQSTYFLTFSGQGYNLLNKFTKEKSSYILSIPNYILNTTEFSYHSVTFPKCNESIFKVLINSTANPIIVGEPVTFVSQVYNGAGPFHYAWYGGGNKNTQNETSIFYSPGNWTVEVIVIDGNGQKAIANYTEKVNTDYSINFNSHPIGRFVSLNSYQIPINSSFIEDNNTVTFKGNFPTNKSISLHLEMVCNVPNSVILKHPFYLFIGFVSFSVNTCSMIYIIRRFKSL